MIDNIRTWLGRGQLFGVVLAILTPISATHAESWVYVSLLREKKIVAFQRDTVSGALERRHETSLPAEPAFLYYSPTLKSLFVALRSSGELASFAVDSSDGKLTLVSKVQGGADPAFLATDRSHKFLASAYYVDNQVLLHSLDGNRIQATPRQTIKTAANAHGLAFDKGNRFLYVPHTGANRVYQFRFDARQGKLAAQDPPYVTATNPQAHPRHVALHPNNQWAYIGNEGDCTLSVYRLEASGILAHMQTVPTVPVGTFGKGFSTARCAMTADGKAVYVANRGHDSIACFQIDQKTGRVRSQGIVPTEATPRSFAISPDSQFLYAAGQKSGQLVAYRIQPTGKIKRLQSYQVGPVAWAVEVVDAP